MRSQIFKIGSDVSILKLTTAIPYNTALRPKKQSWKLQPWEKQAIADGVAKGEKRYALAHEFGVTPAIVTRIAQACGLPRGVPGVRPALRKKAKPKCEPSAWRLRRLKKKKMNRNVERRQRARAKQA